MTRHATTLLTLLAAGIVGTLSSFAAAADDAAQAALLATLQKADASYEQKAVACRDLARIGDKTAVPVLAALLSDEKLSHMARYALEPIPDPSVDKVLRESLDKLTGNMLAGVVSSMGVRRNPESVQPLAKLLGHQDQQVASAAATALGRIADKSAGTALRAALDTAKGPTLLAVGDALLNCADALAAKGDKSGALKFYDAMGATTIPMPIRLAAIRGSILHGGKSGLKLLATQLAGTDNQLFMNALGVSLDFTDTTVTPVLVDILSKLPADRVPSLIQVLARRRDPAALPALIVMAKSGDKPSRLASIAAFAEIGKASAATALIDLLKDPDADINRAAGASLATLQGDEVDTAVIGMLDSADQALRLKAIDMAGQRKIRNALPILVRLMADKEEAVRVAAIRNSADLAGVAELPILLDCLKKASNPSELGSIEKMLVSICGTAPDKEAFSAKLAEAMPRTSQAAKPVLLRVLTVAGGTAALAAVKTATSDTDEDTRLAAIRVLCEWKTPDAAPALLATARGAARDNEKLLALRGYLGMAIRPDVPKETRIDICRQASPLIKRDDETKLLLGATGTLGEPELLDLLMPGIENAGTREDAIATVLAIAGKREKGKSAKPTRAALEKVVSAGNPAQQEAARNLLKQMEGE